MKSIKLHLLTVFLVFFSPTGSAADIKAGQNKSTMCQGCHGINGVSTNPTWPSLAGQQRSYLEKQLQAFRSGTRKNPVMNGLATGLSDQDIENLSAFYASQSSKSAGADPALAKKGKAKVAMCLGCHGNQAQGRGQFPKLAGQHPQYLAKQLNDFKNGRRKAGPMEAMAKNLSEQDIREISAYLGSL